MQNGQISHQDFCGKKNSSIKDLEEIKFDEDNKYFDFSLVFNNDKLRITMTSILRLDEKDIFEKIVITIKEHFSN